MTPKVGELYEDLDPRMKGRRIRCERVGDDRSQFVNVSSYTGRKIYVMNGALKPSPNGRRGYRLLGRDVAAKK